MEKMRYQLIWNLTTDFRRFGYIPSTYTKRVQARACDVFWCPPASSSYIVLHTVTVQVVKKGNHAAACACGSLAGSRDGAASPHRAASHTAVRYAKTLRCCCFSVV